MNTLTTYSHSVGPTLSCFVGPPEWAARQYSRLFEEYLDSIRPQRNEDGTLPDGLPPPMNAWNAYFMALAA